MIERRDARHESRSGREAVKNGQRIFVITAKAGIQTLRTRKHRRRDQSDRVMHAAGG